MSPPPDPASSDLEPRLRPTLPPPAFPPPADEMVVHRGVSSVPSKIAADFDLFVSGNQPGVIERWRLESPDCLIINCMQRDLSDA